MNPAIVAVGYNRPHDLLRLLNSVNAATFETGDVTLVISLDKAPNEAEVVAMAESFEWKHGEKIIRTFPERQGLRKHVLQCGDLSEKYGAVIILEDDLLVSPNFYRYTCQALDFYGDNPKIAGISLYTHEWNGYARKFFTPIADEYDAFLGQIGVSWGQCWTKNSWKGFREWYAEHEDKLQENFDIPYVINKWSAQSWGKYFTHYIVEKDLYYVFARNALSTNYSEAGQHVKVPDNVFQVRLLQSDKKNYVFPAFEDALRYDIFFENMKLDRYFPEEIQKDGICIDLSGLERHKYKQRYILTTRSLPYKIVKQYGLQLRPADMNIIYDIPGDEIRLYDTKEAAVAPKSTQFKEYHYEIRGFNTKQIRKYCVAYLKENFMVRLSAKLNKLFKKKK